MALPACIDAQKAAHGHLAEVYDKIQTAGYAGVLPALEPAAEPSFRSQDKSLAWGSVNIREYEIEVFGGGGVPTEGGPALGLR